MTRLDDLMAARDLMWISLAQADPDRRGPLMAQWRALDKDIAELSGGSEEAGDSIDEIAARRAARGGATSRLGQAGRRPG